MDSSTSTPKESGSSDFKEYLKTHDNATAVSHGLAATARVITAAAAIMVAVFGSFVLGQDRVIK